MLRVSEHAHKTDTGRQRNANEDSYFARAPVFAVADGMGGAQAGEVASSIAARAFEAGVVEENPSEAQLRELVEGANAEIHDLAEKDQSYAGMGTTLTAVLLHGDEVSIAHVGDSRAYLLRDGELKRLTKDHSLVEELRRQGRLTEEEASEHPQRSIITRALGPEAEVEVDTMTYPARDGDVFLLCSDGLTTMVGEDQIAEILGDARTLRSAVTKLIDAANRAGGRDNITAVAFKVESVPGEVDDGATLVASTAEHVGLTAERVREAARRMQPETAATPKQARRRRIVRWVVAVVLIAAIAIGAVFSVRSIYFLGADDGGRVALYRGLPYDLPLGASLYSKQYAIGVQVSSLSPERQGVVTDHTLRSKNDAADIVDDIETREGEKPQTKGSGGRTGQTQ